MLSKLERLLRRAPLVVKDYKGRCVFINYVLCVRMFVMNVLGPTHIIISIYNNPRVYADVGLLKFETFLLLLLLLLLHPLSLSLSLVLSCTRPAGNENCMTQ